MAILGLGRTPANTAGAMVPNTAASSGWALQGRPMLGGDGARGFDNKINAVPKYGGKTIAEGGVPPGAGGGSAQAEAAWKEAMGLLQKQGPYTPEVVNQLTNRRADQTAAAEAVNAEEIRNQAAARGMDPTQAIRQMQQQRQQGNIAFSGDMASRAAEANFAAETPGRMAAAQANLGRQFGGATQNAVAGGGGGVRMPMAQAPARQQTAFSGGTPMPAPAPKPVIAPTPQRQPMSVADRNAAQTQWEKDTNNGMKVYGASHMPGYGGTGRDPKTGALQNPYQVSATRAANTPAPATAFTGAPTITPQQQQQIDAANVRGAPPINTKTNPFSNYGQPTKGSRTLPMTNNPLRLF